MRVLVYASTTNTTFIYLSLDAHTEAPVAVTQELEALQLESAGAKKRPKIAHSCNRYSPCQGIVTARVVY